MKTNTIKRAFAALAVSAVALSATAINASAETAVGYTSTGKAAGFTGASLELSNATLKLEDAKAGNAATIKLSAKSSNGTKFDSTGIRITYDEGLELVPVTIKGKTALAEDLLDYETKKVVEDGSNGVFLTFASSEAFTAESGGTDLWSFQFKVKNPEAGKKYPVQIAWRDGDQFELKGSDDTEKINDYAFSNVIQGYVAIDGVPTTTTTTTAPITTTSTSTTTTTPPTSTTTTTTARQSSATTTKATTTSKKVSTTANKQNSPDTGVPGAGIAVAGLAVAIGTAFVLRKKED